MTRSGSQVGQNAVMHNTAFFTDVVGCDPRLRAAHEATRVHHAARRRGGNVADITGLTNFQNRLFGKQLGVLRDIVPKATLFALLVNPENPNAEPDTKDAQTATDALHLDLRVLSARTEDDLEPAFTAMRQQGVGGLLVGIDSFGTRPERFASLAARHAIPAIYHLRDYPLAGGLVSYGASRVDSWRQAGAYVGRVLNGEKPGDLPVQQSAKFELVINLKTAKALGLAVPPGLLVAADEVIE